MIIHGTWQDELPKIQDNSIDLIIIDPPYLTTKEAWDKNEQVNNILSNELYRILKPTGNFYCWCGIGENSQSLIRWFPVFSEKWIFKDIITWKKQRGMGNRKGWLYTREEILWFVKDNKQFTWNKEFQYDETDKRQKYGFKDLKTKSDFKRFTNVWTDIRETNISWNHKENLSSHFTPKPEKAIERIINLHTKEDDIVLDCFGGSGTTAVVAKRMNRNFIIIEKELEYFEVIKERLE